jgi:hypothetical protein
VQYDRWLLAETSGSFNVVTTPEVIEGAQWIITVVDAAAIG